MIKISKIMIIIIIMIPMIVSNDNVTVGFEVVDILGDDDGANVDGDDDGANVDGDDDGNDVDGSIVG